MSTFTRNMRYDTKKPGPTYMIHEDEDGETSEVSIGMYFNTYLRMPLTMAMTMPMPKEKYSWFSC